VAHYRFQHLTLYQLVLMTSIDIKYVKNLHPIFTKPKRIKIIVGGRGSTKSTGVADYIAALVSNGQLWCCARENQNSIGLYLSQHHLVRY